MAKNGVRWSHSSDVHRVVPQVRLDEGCVHKSALWLGVERNRDQAEPCLDLEDCPCCLVQRRQGHFAALDEIRGVDLVLITCY